ncbi:MAG: TIM-barrel domain-containing protein [Actinocrinis sp.]
MSPRALRSTRWRMATAAISAGVVIAGTLAAAVPASAAPTSGASQHAVVSGDARFEVLSPTLIRTEYAGNGAFENDPTFNAIGRDGFAPTVFTQEVVNGWLTIDTDRVQLRYKVGSGPFTTGNLTVTERAGKQAVTADPWTAAQVPSCQFGALCEAEDLALAGPTVASDHNGFTGTGFAAGFQNTGDSLTFQVTVAAAGTYDLDTRYANSTGGDGQNVTRTLSVTAGGAATTLSLPTTANWDTWGLATASVTLSAGTNTVTIARSATDSGNVNVDSLAVVTPGAAYPGPAAPQAKPCAFGTVCQAESGALVGGATVQNNHNDYAGAGFVGGLSSTSASDAIDVTGVPEAGTYQLQLRYANWQTILSQTGAADPRTISVAVGAGAPATTTLAATSSWDSWRTVAIPVTLAAGDNTVTLGCPTADACHVNLDTVAVTKTNAPLLAPHAALGGYRRGLDGQNGEVVTAPGLLYQDGWSLLDDTASAIFNSATHKVTQRPSNGGKPYLDGYVFAYGQNYQQGLKDLATLTGPSELLPRWAYGVWYSEYYDHSAADYENTILPTFRSQGTPLDVLVTDTDFKAGSTWDGWEMDPGKFPDPSAYFAWAHSQGLHTTLNVHPSVQQTDPQFPQALAAAGGTLPSCGSGQYCFDWGNAAQLSAYFGLHQQIQGQGNDFWWLDWCCDSSTSSLSGVTPDAWINQNYAWDTDSTVGRGFAFSRAYSSLNAGGYSGSVGLSTGPWADKRTTVHFTGDTTSSWATLAMEVGYTPGESASTGLSAVSHDIGGFNNGGDQSAGAEPGSTKLSDDLYARWVQLGTFQPVDRLHSNHSDRLPWQYGTAAKNSAEKFLNLRENLVPYTYALAQQATATGVPVTRPTYLQYPDQQDAYAFDGSEYFYGPDVLVAPVTTSGASATTQVWFPAGSSWTDYFTGKTYQGGTVQNVATGLDTMPVFIKSGGIMTTRTGDVTNDDQNPLTKATVTVAEGAPGSFSLYEDNGTTTNSAQSTTTKITYANHKVTIDPVRGGFAGQVRQRTWTIAFQNANPPTSVSLNGATVTADKWTWDANSHTLTVNLPTQSVNQRLMISYK